MVKRGWRAPWWSLNARLGIDLLIDPPIYPKYHYVITAELFYLK
jgi:hypothetical protein